MCDGNTLMYLFNLDLTGPVSMSCKAEDMLECSYAEIPDNCNPGNLNNNSNC